MGARRALEPAPRTLSRHGHQVCVERHETLRRPRNRRIHLDLHAKEGCEVGIGLEKRRMKLVRADEHDADVHGCRHGPEGRRIEPERTKRVLRPDTLLTKHALEALPNDGVDQEVRRARDEGAAAGPVERTRANARKVGQERSVARATLEISKEIRIRRVRLVNHGRRRTRRIGHEQVDLESAQTSGKLGIVLLLARELSAILLFFFGLDEVLPVFDERALSAPEPSARVAAQGGERRFEPFDGLSHDGGGRARKGGRARGVEARALGTHTVRRSVDLASELHLRRGQRALGGIVEHVELLGAHGLAVQHGKRLNAAVHRPDAKSQRLGHSLEVVNEGAVLGLELRRELGLRPLELVAIDHRRDVRFELLDERVEGRYEGGASAGWQDEWARRLGMVEVVNVDDVVRGRTRDRDSRRVLDDVVFHLHFRFGGHEHVKARFSGL